MIRRLRPGVERPIADLAAARARRQERELCAAIAASLQATDGRCPRCRDLYSMHTLDEIADHAADLATAPASPAHGA